MVSLIHYFKYKNCDYLAEFLGQLMNKQLKRIGFSASSYDFIAPVPLHKHKLKLRGYNQAELLARILSNYFKIPLRNDIIYELNAKPPQARLAQNLRQANAQGAFKSKENLNGSRIVLVDDILTTGATAGACCKTLKENGAAAITVITLSKTLQK
jgi:ComF family protein